MLYIITHSSLCEQHLGWAAFAVACIQWGYIIIKGLVLDKEINTAIICVLSAFELALALQHFLN